MVSTGALYFYLSFSKVDSTLKLGLNEFVDLFQVSSFYTWFFLCLGNMD
jgi:hypothetical protein